MKEEDAPVELCLEVLRRLDAAGVLKDMVLVGSWCGYFYRDLFHDRDYGTVLRTRDMDFLIATPPKFTTEVNVGQLLKDLGFIADISGRGLVRLSHPDLLIDFLVPEKGRGSGKPFPIKALGVNAQPIRFLNLLLERKVTVRVGGIGVAMPHPINFSLQKLIISNRRRNQEKKAKDRRQAVEALRAVVRKGDGGLARKTFDAMPPKWRKAALAALEAADAQDILKLMRDAKA